MVVAAFVIASLALAVTFVNMYFFKRLLDVLDFEMKRGDAILEYMAVEHLATDRQREGECSTN